MEGKGGISIFITNRNGSDSREMRFIRDTLEERAREDVFRLKRLKGHEK